MGLQVRSPGDSSISLSTPSQIAVSAVPRLPSLRALSLEHDRRDRDDLNRLG